MKRAIKSRGVEAENVGLAAWRRTYAATGDAIKADEAMTRSIGFDLGYSEWARMHLEQASRRTSFIRDEMDAAEVAS